MVRLEADVRALRHRAQCVQPPRRFRRWCAGSRRVRIRCCSAVPALRPTARYPPRLRRCASSSPRRRSSTTRRPSTRPGSTASTTTGRRWSRDSRRDFTNLGFGDYRFHVRARNITGQVSNDATYAFTILPPWYRTWWAYAGYVALLGLTFFGVDRLQRRRVVGKERERAQLAEAKLRAEAAEVLARTESEGKKNIELLSDIGREITASLDFETIFGKLYERVNQLVDADVFGVGPLPPRAQARSSTGWPSKRASATRRTPATRPTPTSCRCGASSIASRWSSTTSRPSSRSTSAGSRRRASASKTGRCPRRRSRSSTCRSKPRTACSASSPSRASRSTPTPTTTSTCCRAWRRIRPSRSTTPPPIAS